MEKMFNVFEKKVLNLIVKGDTTDVIARSLNLDVETIEAAKQSIYAKLGVSSRLLAVVEATKQNLI